jgi:hypothetical protein
MRTLIVDAAWDDDAGVWVATSDDIPGLATEAPDLAGLRAKLIDLVPELLSENGSGDPGAASVPIEIVARQRLTIDA